MPWKIERRNGKHCVVNEATGGTEKCHTSRSDAVAHMRALYANVDEKEVDMDTENLEKFIGSMGPTSFAELDVLIEEQEKNAEMVQLTSAFHFLVDNVLSDGENSDKGTAIKLLADELSERLSKAASREEKGLVESVKDYVKEKLGPRENDTKFILTKNNNGQWVWFAKYSNKFRDNDNPPEIIAEESHMGFVDKVNSGLAPYPELWLWHVRGTTWGKSVWVGYDTQGFALAAGFVEPEYYDLAEELHGREDILLSHGMPTDTIVRNSEDSSIIVEHETREISVLPYWAAANKLTGFVVLKENTDMSEMKDKGIAPEDRQKLIDELHLPASIVDRMEASNQKDANLATAVGLEFKEEAEVEETEVESEEPVQEAEVEEQPEEVEEVEVEETEAIEEVEEEDSEDDDLKQAVGSLIDAIGMLHKQLQDVQSELNDLKQAQEELNKEVGNTPLASRASLMFESVVGKERTRVDGRTKDAQDGPKETDPNQSDGLLFFQKEGWV